jgi:hypothetical protein
MEKHGTLHKMEKQGTLHKMARLPTGDERVVLPDRIQLCLTYGLEQVTKQSRDSLVGTDRATEVSWFLLPPSPQKNPLHRVQTGPGAQLASLSKGNAHIPLQ